MPAESSIRGGAAGAAADAVSGGFEHPEISNAAMIAQPARERGQCIRRIVLASYNRPLDRIEPESTDAKPMPEWVVGLAETGLRLDKYLAAAERLGSRTRASSALGRGKVFVNNREATSADAGKSLAAGDIVRLWMDRPGSARRRMALGDARDLPIVYEDEQLVVLNKPPGVLAVPLPLGRRENARSVFDDLKAYLHTRSRRRPFVVHRIDRDTSGLVVFATNLPAQERLKEQFRRRMAERVYLAVVYGEPSPSAGVWQDRLVWDERSLIQKETHPRNPRGKDATSHYRVIDARGRVSLIEVTLETGRRNQIRVQARLRGHTLVGEQRYIYGPSDLRPIAFPRQALHACRLAFTHPEDGRMLRFEASLPDDLAELLRRLRLRWR
jgi:23S rRNA pseudouridine1911/1915/1917 synthase